MKKTRIILYTLIVLLILVFGIHGFVVFSGGKMLNNQVSQTLDGKVYTEADINSIMKDNENADCILVLGAGVYSDGTPTPMLKDRLDRGIQLYKLKLAPKILLSGDNGQVEYNEVAVMLSYALEQGIPEEDIFLDHAGFSTYESMYRAKAIFNVKKALVVTQKYHEFRALYIGKRLGLDVIGISANDTSYSGNIYREIREVLAREKDFFQCIFKPEPTYLGDTIDINGNGQITW
ncbi:MAG: YdcF family protein [Firmicutes bacterium]|nr:YdcF family protein [Bacillota bacterium]